MSICPSYHHDTEREGFYWSMKDLKVHSEGKGFIAIPSGITGKGQMLTYRGLPLERFGKVGNMFQKVVNTLYSCMEPIFLFFSFSVYT